MIDFWRKKSGKVWRIGFLFVSLERLFFKNIMAMEKIILNKLTKDEVLMRLQESKRRKQDRLKELEEGLRADFRNVTGVEAKKFVVW